MGLNLNCLRSMTTDNRERKAFDEHICSFPFADQQARMRRVATRPGSTVALVANESINQQFKSPAENFCRW